MGGEKNYPNLRIMVRKSKRGNEKKREGEEEREKKARDEEKNNIF